MAPNHSRTFRHRWQDRVGRDTIQQIVKFRIPEWVDGLRDWQLDIVSRILDEEDVLVSTATGDGKSAIFAVPLVVLLEMQRRPTLYPDLSRRELPMGIVITPTKGLASNIVYEIDRLGVAAIAYCSEVLTEARKSGRQLWKEIAAGKWPLVCVDPEHLTAKDWEHISNTDSWRENLSFVCVDEVHLVYEWGDEFRPAFRHIGQFARSRCPPHISVFGLSATLEPGRSMSTICNTLGFVEGHFYHAHRTNERPNIHFILQTLTHTLGGDSFPDLLPFLSSNRKSVIYCATIELCWRVIVYLWGLLPPGLEKLTRVRLYHAMCWPDENEKTIQLIRDDPRCQVVVATIAFAQGFNVKPLLDSLQLGIATTLNQLVQQEGRIGRDLVSLARGVVLVQPKAIQSAEQYMKVHNVSESSTTLQPVKKKKATKIVRMDHSKARLLVEKGCIIALRNIIYQNPPLELSKLDCIDAARAVPCSRCLPRSNVVLEFTTHPSHQSLTPFRVPERLPLLLLPPILPGQVQKAEPPLTKKMRELAMEAFNVFRDCVRRHEKAFDTAGSAPRSSYLPTHFVTSIINKLLSLTTVDDIRALSPGWEHHMRHGVSLLCLVVELQTKFRDQHEATRLLRNEKNRLRAKAKRDLEKQNSQSTDEVEVEDIPITPIDVETPVPIPIDAGVVLDVIATRGRKRGALQDETNRAAQKRPRVPLQSVSSVLQSFGPQYQRRATRSRRTETDENRAL